MVTSQGHRDLLQEQWSMIWKTLKLIDFYRLSLFLSVILQGEVHEDECSVKNLVWQAHCVRRCCHVSIWSWLEGDSHFPQSWRAWPEKVPLLRWDRCRGNESYQQLQVRVNANIKISYIFIMLSIIRYLIFFDDGCTQYVPHQHVRLVIKRSPQIWDDCHQDIREFVRSYLELYPENPMVRLAANQKVKTEWNSKLQQDDFMQTLNTNMQLDGGSREWRKWTVP